MALPPFFFMRTCPCCQENKTEESFGRNRKRPDGLQAYCRVCTRAKLRASYRRNRASWNQRSVAYAKKNPERVRMHDRAYKQRVKEKMRPVYAAATAERRAAKIKATPAWLSEADRNSINTMYDTCPAGHQVDHIVPLRGKEVCGLHVPWNLQHLPADMNRRKGNRL